MIALRLILLFSEYPFLFKFCHLQLTRTSITDDVEAVMATDNATCCCVITTVLLFIQMLLQ